MTERVLGVFGVAVVVAELLAICLLRQESAQAIRPLTIGAAAVCVMALVQVAAAGPRAWRWWLTPPALWHWGPFVAYAAAVSASGYLAAPGAYPRIPVEAWWFAGLAIATARIARGDRGRRFTLAILIAALAVLMPGILGPKSGQDLSGRFLRYSALVGWGAYPEIGMLGLFGASAALAIVLTARTWTLRTAAAILAVLFGIVPFAVNSRGAILTLIATAGWLVTVVTMRGPLLRGHRRLAWTLVAAACLTILAGAVVYRARIASIARANGEVHATAAVATREAYWRVAIRMMAAHPLLGAGPGRYPIEFSRYSAVLPQNHAHSMLLHVGAETGLLGLIPFALIWARLLWLTLRASGPLAGDAADAGEAGEAGDARRDAFVLHALIAAFFIRAASDQFLSSVHSSFRTTLLMAMILGLAEAAVAARARRVTAVSTPPI